MSDNTKIEWADATVNAINGCAVTSPGCTHCYAMKLAGTRMRDHPTRAGLTTQTKAGPVWNGEVRLHEPALLQPLKWTKPRRIFWNAHGDTFHDAVPDEWIDRMMAVCALTPQHTHMILTKRSARMREYMASRDVSKVGDPITFQAFAMNRVGRGHSGSGGSAVWPLPNVWLGVSVEDQTRADERIPDLLATPAAIRFISAEPLLGPVDLARIGFGQYDNEDDIRVWIDALKGGDWSAEIDNNGALCGIARASWGDKLDWVIAGGESGPDARPMHPDWTRSLRDQCAAANVPFHFKQWGEWRIADCELGEAPRIKQRDFWRVGKKRAGRLLDGIEHDGLPEQQP